MCYISLHIVYYISLHIFHVVRFLKTSLFNNEDIFIHVYEHCGPILLQFCSHSKYTGTKFTMVLNLLA